MKVLSGPILSYRGGGTTKWQLSIIVVTDGDPPEVSFNGQALPSARLWSVKKWNVHRFLFEVDLRANEYNTEYRVGADIYPIAIPAKSRAPRMAYASCNGFSSLKEMKKVDVKNRLWMIMRGEHEKNPYNILLLGGDQVYADEMWEIPSALKEWNTKPYAVANKANFTNTMSTYVTDLYARIYTERWAQPEVAYMMARVPSINMWDDHDIFDGWGSYPNERQACPVYQGIFQIASKAFSVFQQHLADNEQRPGAIGSKSVFSFGYIIGDVAILSLDMRSERTQDQVISQGHWEQIYTWLDNVPEQVNHLLLMSSIPVVYPGFSVLESLLGSVPGQWDLEDDLRDHWNSRPHKAERLRLIHRLYAFARAKGIRPTIISGDVHVAAVGVVEDHRLTEKVPVVINQLISSGVVHPSPPAAIVFVLQNLLDRPDEVDRGIVARMTEFPGNNTKFLGKRNYLSLEPGTKERIWANWFVEDEPHPYTKTIHAIPKQPQPKTTDVIPATSAAA